MSRSMGGWCTSVGLYHGARGIAIYMALLTALALCNVNDATMLLINY